MVSGLVKADELFVPDGCDQFEFGADTDISVAGPIEVVRVTIRLENLTTKERVRPLFEHSNSIWNANHMVVLALWRVNPISPQPDLPSTDTRRDFHTNREPSSVFAIL